MLTFRATGSIADVIASVRDVPARLVPYATATALTRTAQIAAKKDLPDAMSRVFDRPVPYTLNSLLVKPANKDTLSARVMVKDFTSNNGTLPEDYLLPSVIGGGRNEKRFERLLRYRGMLPDGWRAILGADAPVDAFGNLPFGEMQRIMTALGANRDKWQNRSNSARSKANAKNAPYFVITPFRGFFTGGEYKVLSSSTQPGVYKRMGDRKIIPILIFTNKKPLYRARFDFPAIVEQCAQANFKTEFDRAFAEMRAKGKF